LEEVIQYCSVVQDASYQSKWSLGQWKDN
jgi:hypothetical protein